MPHIMYALDVDQALLPGYVLVCVCSSCHWGASNGQPLLPSGLSPNVELRILQFCVLFVTRCL